MAKASEKKWLPLEANPDVMTKFASKLGLPEIVAFNDVFGLDEELLAMVPRPVLAVLLLFPLPPKEDESAGPPQTDATSPAIQPFFMKQTIGNACGTIGLLHAIGNSTTTIPLADGSFLDRFFKAAASMSPAERGKFLEESPDLEVAHSSAAESGDTRPPSIDDDTDLHFIAFVTHNGTLYELDGRKAGPVPHGASSPDTVLEDSVKVVKDFMNRSPQSLQFNLIAMCSDW